MQIGVLGSGDVGRTLAAGVHALGHTVMLGTGHQSEERVQQWVTAQGAGAAVGTFAEAAAFGELLVFTIRGDGVEAVIAKAGPEHFAGNTVLDTTNPLDFSGPVPTLFVGQTDSMAERIQRLLPGAHVVKAFNYVGFNQMVHPQLPGGPPTLFLAGDDADANAAVATLGRALGWEPLEVGGLFTARFLEPLAMVWILTAMRDKVRGQALKMLRT